VRAPPTPPPRPPAAWRYETVHDAGDLGCGDLALDLRLAFRGVPPGTRVLVVASDAGAVEEIPSWCRLTGNRLLGADPPWYWVARGAGAGSPPPEA